MGFGFDRAATSRDSNTTIIVVSCDSLKVLLPLDVRDVIAKPSVQKFILDLTFSMVVTCCLRGLIVHGRTALKSIMARFGMHHKASLKTARLNQLLQPALLLLEHSFTLLGLRRRGVTTPQPICGRACLRFVYIVSDVQLKRGQG